MKKWGVYLINVASFVHCPGKIPQISNTVISALTMAAQVDKMFLSVLEDNIDSLVPMKEKILFLIILIRRFNLKLHLVLLQFQTAFGSWIQTLVFRSSS